MSNEQIIETVKRIVSEYHGIPVENVFSKSRKKELVFPRQIAWTILAWHGGNTLTKIGATSGHGHSNVIHARKKIQGYIDMDRAFRFHLREVLAKVVEVYPQLSSLCNNIPVDASIRPSSNHLPLVKVKFHEIEAA